MKAGQGQTLRLVLVGFLFHNYKNTLDILQIWFQITAIKQVLQ